MSSPVRLVAVPLAFAAGALFASPTFAQTPAASPSRASVAPVAVPTSAQVQASTAEARRLSDGFVAVAERASPSVVQIDITARDDKTDLLARFFGREASEEPVARGTGSGVVFTPDGAILTNNHVVEAALSINVRLRDGRYLPATLVGRDPATDLAVIKIDASGLSPVRFADSEAARVGEWVVAIGSPFGLGYTVTAGVLSAKGRGGLGMNAIEDYLQTDASINPGNSGGPLCNLQGEVLGINTMIVGRGQGIGFAVPSNMAQRVADQILKTGRVSRGWIGVTVQDVTPELATSMHLTAGSGALVNNVASDGPAFHSNIRPGDVIASVGGHPIHDSHELIRDTIAQEVGQPLQLEIIRSGQHYGANVTLAERPEAAVEPAPLQQQAPRQGMGLVVRDLSPDQAAQMNLGAKRVPVLTQVTPGSAADRAGLRAGDVIVEANGVQDPSSTQVAELAHSGQLVLRVKRGDAFFYAALKR
ncbi:MAG TPA: trypsin-like peptidase domain-containing protein [Polyangiaceae bacterium]|nr:trypsin-like peptidase domain-containing protein [Polyangiaceae bacterium]